ncbi:hypothetical protein ILUMI_02299 [Ignelater luminosus]|uniref:Uncharacterized protein n=1 Tax=Ignelater luminosus TaxID=2038154 RepID=A0A8K0DGP7_IGNLU|nr:hypothetical protein ILUMI_02299 [Ignelater luminosus]
MITFVYIAFVLMRFSNQQLETWNHAIHLLDSRGHLQLVNCTKLDCFKESGVNLAVIDTVVRRGQYIDKKAINCN